MSLTELPLFERLLEASPLSRRELAVLIATAPSRYKDHYIDKRNGRGRRLISQPTAELKYFQRFLTEVELANLPLHECAVAYRRGLSIKDHAAPHASARYLLKLDFKDFFPSLKAPALEHQLSLDAGYSGDELRLLSQLLFRMPRGGGELCLSIGAPSSPFISNYLMHPFDSAIADFCGEREVTYTRYADDLAFSTSTPRLLDEVLSRVAATLDELKHLGLVLNNSKTVNVSTKFQRRLVGLTLSNEGSASIGREQKRILRSAIHAIAIGKPGRMPISRLKGLLAHAYSIDPTWVRKLCARHGFADIESIGDRTRREQ
jgi:RNA-directed DNA polymerase